jgi:ATP-dependent helicase/nuclease subunit A
MEREADSLAAWPEMEKSYASRFRDVSAQLRAWRTAAERGWDAMGRVEITFPALGRVNDKSLNARKEQAQTVWNACKKEVREKLSETYRTTSAEHLTDMALMAPAMLALAELTEDFTSAYQAEKVRRGCLDYSDQEHYAIELLTGGDGGPTELAEQLSGRYREVMVDEYQDSNEVQDWIFRALSGGGERLFTVGDVKQSIYRFRLADPTIFLRKYNAYRAAGTAAEGEPRKVLLQSNFRSRQQVLDAVNFIFGGILSEQMGEMAYGDEERLNFGAAYYLPRTDADTEFHLVSVPRSGEEEFDRDAVEAQFIARRVRQLLDEGYPVQEGDGFRPVRPEDIVVLMRSPSVRQQGLAEAMARENVPFAAAEDGDFFSSMEIAVMLSFLEIIDNPRQDVPLISVMRSPLFGFTPDRLAAIRALQPAGDYYEAVCLDESEDTRAFLARLDSLRRAARDLPADRLLWQIYSDCSALAVFGAMADGERRRSNLIALFTYAGGLAASGKGTLFDFVTHLRELLERDVVPAVSTRQSTGGVRLMSVHKSKGLEFPVVILADTQKKFNTTDIQTPVLVHPQLGLGTDCVDRQRRIRYGTVSKNAIAMTMDRQNKAEEMRILYVAMTRPKEKLIIVDCLKGAEKRLKDLAAAASYPADPEAVSGAKCFGDWLLLPLLCAREGEPLRRWAGLEPAEEPVLAPGWSVQVWDEMPAAPAEEREDPSQDRSPEEPFDPTPLERRYGHERATVIPTKVTATQLKGRELDEEIAEGAPRSHRAVSFETPLFLQRDRRLTGAERGTAMHLAMQFLDFTAPDGHAVAEQVSALRERRLMTPEQAEAVDCGAIAAFLHSPLAERIRAAGQVYREYRFALLMPAVIYDSAAEDEELLLQGVVDCAFDAPEGLVILDFKTDRIAPGGEAARAETYRPQLEAYAAALSRVLERPVAERWLWFFATGQAFQL